MFWRVLWQFFQAVVMFLVFCTDINWHWSTGPLVTGIIAAGVAWCATVILSRIIDLFRFRSAVDVQPAGREEWWTELGSTEPVQEADLPDTPDQDVNEALDQLARELRHPPQRQP